MPEYIKEKDMPDKRNRRIYNIAVYVCKTMAGIHLSVVDALDVRLEIKKHIETDLFDFAGDRKAHGDALSHLRSKTFGNEVPLNTVMLQKAQSFIKEFDSRAEQGFKLNLKSEDHHNDDMNLPHTY